ncbi:MAG: MBOAT family protein [Bacteroidetes bacterium]|nr:MBOAT family protein [Bacteroidota bacterium]
MLFNSVHFIWFLPLVITLYYLLPGKFRWILLLAASYTFYMFWRVEYAAIILGSTFIDFWAGRQMGKRATPRARLPFLLASLTCNFGLLFTFKYAGFFGETLNSVFDAGIEPLHLLLPVGISFYTFQSVGYMVDVYKGKSKPEAHFGYFALFVAYWPQLVAGPIERYHHIGPQLHATQKLEYDNLANGFRLIVLGFFAKMVVADNLAVLVNQFYENPVGFGRRDAALSLVAYSFQIYCDFYGYSLIAIGSARLMGVRLADNFRTPYLSSSVAEFWQRWHISLSTWFRDYLFIPLGGSRVGLARWAFNAMIVFTVSGFWHGARWTFVIWGAAWGLFYVLEKLLNKLGSRKNAEKEANKAFSIGKLIRIPIIFLLATAAWVPFRSESLEKMALVGDALIHQHAGIQHFDIPWVTFAALGIFLLLDALHYKYRPEEWFSNRPFILRWAIYAILIFGTLAFAAVEEVPFIYFQF